MFFEGMSEDLICSIPDEKIDFNEIDNFNEIKKTETKNNRKKINLVIPKGSSLPSDHKPFRGRARIYQLENMTKKQKKEEQFLRLERNRLAAIEIRKKKKEYIFKIESQLKNLKKNIKEQIRDKDIEIRNLNTKIKFLTDQILGNQEQKQEN